MRIAKLGADILNTPRRLFYTMAGVGSEVQERYGVRRARQMAQMLHYRHRLGASRAEYYMFELYRPDLNDEARQRFLTQLAWYALARVINQPHRRSDSSKIALSQHFVKAGIPTPRTLGYTAPSPTAEQRSAKDFIELSELPSIAPASGCVLKRDLSGGGRGVIVFKSFGGGIFEHVDGRRIGIDGVSDIVRKQGGTFLVQERLDNHPDFAALDLPSLMTLRVLTYGSGNDIRVARVSLKFPIGRKGVDNYHAGGIAAPIDLESGRIGRAIGAQGMEWLSAHPETGKRFEGMIVPHWGDVLAEALRAARSMPDFRCVGWDVAVTPHGVRILEGNSVWATELVQRPHRQGMWDGDFKRWCTDQIRDVAIPSNARRWLGLEGA